MAWNDAILNIIEIVQFGIFDVDARARIKVCVLFTKSQNLLFFEWDNNQRKLEKKLTIVSTFCIIKLYQIYRRRVWDYLAFSTKSNFSK